MAWRRPWPIVSIGRSFLRIFLWPRNPVSRKRRPREARRVLVEDSGTGTALVQELRRRVAGIIAITPKSDKVSRMAVASAKFEAGQVFLPERAPWLADLEAELFVFPSSRCDDQCDSISQALEDSNLSFMHWLTPSDWEVILAKARIPTRRFALQHQGIFTL
jgi:predicted phage terminase large subunit-like protein